jgi:hypothetical protein
MRCYYHPRRDAVGFVKDEVKCKMINSIPGHKTTEFQMALCFDCYNEYIARAQKEK